MFYTCPLFKINSKKFEGLENDLRALMKEIEEALAAVHSMQHVSTTSSSNDKTMDWKTDSSSGGDAFEGSAHRTSNQVFLRAEEISPGSPAEQSVYCIKKLVEP